MSYRSVALETNTPVVQHHPAFVWKVHYPLLSIAPERSESPRLPAWLNAVYALRGGLSHHHDQPPCTVVAPCHGAPDPADFTAYHVLAYNGPTLVASVRLSPFTAEMPSITESCLGLGPIEQCLDTLGLHVKNAIEGGHWIVHPDYRQARLAVFLAAAAVTLARHLGYATLFCPVGTTDKQHRVLARLGLQPVPHMQPFSCTTCADTLQVMYLMTTRPNRGLAVIMDGMGKKLELTRHLSTVLSGLSLCRSAAR